MTDPNPPTVPADLSSSPTAHLWIDATGKLAWCNEAARSLLGPRALAEPAALATALNPSGQSPWPAGPTRLPGCSAWVKVRHQALGAQGWLIALEAADALAEAQVEADRQASWLSLAAGAMHLGTWWRDPHSLEGFWDRQVFAFWGLDPARGTPSFEAALQRVVPEDREALRARFLDSLGQPGDHELRYRSQRSDGSIGRLLSRWRVPTPGSAAPAEIRGILLDDTERWRLSQAHDLQSSEIALAENLIVMSRWRHDLQTQRMHYNRHSWAMLGLEPRPGGMAIDEVRALVHPEDLPAVLASAEHTLRTGEPSDFQARYRHADGHWMQVHSRRALERDAMGKPRAFIGVSLDLTGLLEARQVSAELGGRLEAAARSAGIGTWNLPHGARRANWNTQMRELHGLSEDAPVPTFEQWLAAHVHPEDRELARRTLLKLGRDARTSADMELRLVTADGSPRWIMTHTQVERGRAGTALFGIVIDVSERRRADRALHLAQERVSLAAVGAGIGTFEVELATGKAYWDAQMWRLRGLPAADQPPTPEGALALVHPDDRARARGLIETHFAAAGPVTSEFRVVWPSGEVRWLASRSALVEGLPGQSARRIGINWDITDQRHADDERRERLVAERASRAKSELLSRVSHELRTPMNAVLGFTQLLLAGADSGDAASRREQLGHVQAAGEHLLALINDVLDLTAVESGRLQLNMASVTLAPLVQSVLTMLEPLRREAGLPPVELRLAPGLAVRADAMRLRQVLVNLLSNAIKYNRPNGWIRVGAEADGQRLALQVNDGGVGLTPAQLGGLFQPFNRLGHETRAVPGSGIGLAISKALVEHMGGSLSATSTADSGSCFTVRLALAEPAKPSRAQAAHSPGGGLVPGQAAAPPPAPPAAPPPAPPAAPPPRASDAPPPAPRAAPPRASITPPRGPDAAADLRGCVLYVEDNPVNALLVRQMLGQATGLRLLEAASGAEGLALAQRERPDLVLLDLELPDMHGHEVLRRLRAHEATAALTCVALSANALPEDLERARQAGFARYWTKPLDFGAFVDGVRELLADRTPR